MAETHFAEYALRLFRPTRAWRKAGKSVTWLEALAGVKEFIVTCSALAGVTIAYLGLNAWKRQLAGKTEYELARRILMGIFKYRDAFRVVRNPWGPSFKPDEVGDKSKKYSKTREFHEERWKYIQEVRKTIYPDLLEAEAAWGDKLNHLFQKLFVLENELHLHIQQYLEILHPHQIDRECPNEFINIRKDKWGSDIMYDHSPHTQDKFSDEINSAGKETEDFLRPKLKL